MSNHYCRICPTPSVFLAWGIVFFGLLAGGLPSECLAEAPSAQLVFCCETENDLYRVIQAGGERYPLFDRSQDAIEQAPAGAGVLILARGYPETTTPLDAELFQRAAEKKLRLYVEYPSMFPDTAVGEVKTLKHGPWGVLWERGVVTSDFFGEVLPPLSIVMINDCHYVAVAAEKPHLVRARVAGYDRAAPGLPEQTEPILFQIPQRDVLVSTTKLSQFVTGRYAPTDVWRSVWRGIFQWLQAGEDVVQPVWTPTVRTTYDRTAPLPHDAQRQAVRRGAEWFLRSGLLVDPQWPHREHREDELKPVLWPEWKPGDGSRGILEGFMSRTTCDGRQGVSLSIRADCNAESAMAMALGAELTGNARLRETAERLIRYNLFDSPMAGGSRADPHNPNYGMIGWSLNNPGAYYGDDNARVLLGTIAVAASQKEDEFTPFLLRGVLANFRVTGPQGFRPALLGEGDLVAYGWRHYGNTDIVQHSPHYEAWIWATYLWLYHQTGYPPLKDRAREGIGRMMAAYPDGWLAECGRREADLARMLLPLAWLVRVEDTPEHRGWLRRVADDLIALQDASGAIPQWVTAPIGANEQYGTGEAPIIYANGDPAADLLYTMNFAAIGLHEAAAATGEAQLVQAADRTADFLIRCQVRSETHPELDGAWFRSFDFRRWEYYGSDGDLGWGVWSAETGWTQGWIVTTLALRELKTSLWDFAAQAPVGDSFEPLRTAMLSGEVPSMPAESPATWLTYHLAHPGETAPGDPNGAFFWKGRYHLHYIYENNEGVSWAHVSSRDMLHWRWHPTTLTPATMGHSMFSGTGFFTREGRPAIIYHGQESGRNQVAMAEDDRLEKWSKPVAVEPRTTSGELPEMRHWDPDCWLDGEAYYAVSGGRDPHLMKSSDLKNWAYLGRLLHKDMPDVGVPRDEDISCPNMFRIGDKWMLLCLSHWIGCRYYLGHFQDEKFVPETHATMNWMCDFNGDADLFAPESLLTPDGRRVMWAWVRVRQRLTNVPIQSSIQSLPRELSLPEDGVLRIRPLRELETLRCDEKSETDITVPSGEVYRLREISGDTLEIRLVIQSTARRFGVRVYTDREGGQGFPIAVQPNQKVLTLGETRIPFELKPDEDLEIRIFLDKSIVEVFVNDRQAALAPHQYAPENLGVCLFSEGGTTLVKEVKAWRMRSIYAKVNDASQSWDE